MVQTEVVALHYGDEAQLLLMSFRVDSVYG